MRHSKKTKKYRKRRKYKRKSIIRYKSFITHGGNTDDSKIVEITFNASKESERLKTLQPIIDFYKVTPSYSVWGEEAKDHKWFGKFNPKLLVAEISLAINFIVVFDKYKDANKYLFHILSDATPVNDIKDTDDIINNIIKEMKNRNIDFVFLGEPVEDFSQFPKITDTLLKSNKSTSTYSYIMSPNGIQNFLKYFHDKNDHDAIDWAFNYFFKENPSCFACWRVPELFKNGKYKSLIGEGVRGLNGQRPLIK